MRKWVIFAIVAAGCGAPAANQPHGTISINNASMRYVSNFSCGQQGNLTCQAYDVSFTLSNSAAAGPTTAIVRIDDMSLTIGDQTYAPPQTSACNSGPWMVQGGTTSSLLDVTVQTGGDPYFSFHCGSYDWQVQVPGLPAMPTTGTIGLTIEGLMGDASTFKAVAPVTIL